MLHMKLLRLCGTSADLSTGLLRTVPANHGRKNWSYRYSDFHLSALPAQSTQRVRPTKQPVPAQHQDWLELKCSQQYMLAPSTQAETWGASSVNSPSAKTAVNMYQSTFLPALNLLFSLKLNGGWTWSLVLQSASIANSFITFFPEVNKKQITVLATGKSALIWNSCHLAPAWAASL